MPLIHCPDPALTNLLTDLTTLLEANGAWFNPDMVIDADEYGNITIKSASGQSDRRSFVRIPLAVMPRQQEYDVTLNRDNLQCSPLSKDTDPLQTEIMEQMTAVYNACNKVGHWITASPLFALDRWPDVKTLLFQAKANTPKFQHFQTLLDAGDIDKLKIESFLGSRVFHLLPQFLQAPGQDVPGKGQPVIMPIIDYFNHRFQAEGYSVQNTPPPPSMRVFGVPDPDTWEVSVRYNLYDPVDTFLFYGFVDTRSPWLASTPMTLDLPDGRKLNVLNTGGSIKKQLPSAVKDLRLYLPMVKDPDKEEVKINKLMIPGSAAPKALQRVLAGLLKSLCKDLDRQQQLQWVEKMETAVLETNRQWWHKLGEKASTLPEETGAAADLRTLCALANKHLVRYVNQRNYPAGQGVTNA